MLLIAFEVYDTERDMLPLELTSFSPATVTNWAAHFQREYTQWPSAQSKPTELVCTFFVDEQPYLVRARFHTWESIAKLLANPER